MELSLLDIILQFLLISIPVLAGISNPAAGGALSRSEPEGVRNERDHGATGTRRGWSHDR